MEVTSAMYYYPPRRRVRDVLFNPWFSVPLLLVVAVVAFFALRNAWTTERFMQPTLPGHASVSSLFDTAKALNGVEDRGVDTSQNQVTAYSTKPTTAELLIDGKPVPAQGNDTAKMRHDWTWTVPAFTGDSHDFVAHVTLKTQDGKVVKQTDHKVHVLQQSFAAGGIHSSQQFVDFVNDRRSESVRADLVKALKAADPNYPGMSTLSASNLAAFAKANQSKFEIRQIQAPVTGDFAFVVGGNVHFGHQTLPVGTPMVFFDGRPFADAECLNPPSAPIPPPPSTPAPSPTPPGGHGGCTGNTCSTPTPTPTPHPTPSPTPSGKHVNPSAEPTVTPSAPRPSNPPGNPTPLPPPPTTAPPPTSSPPATMPPQPTPSAGTTPH